MKHPEYTPRPKESAQVFRCSAERCGQTLRASLRARLDNTTCRAEEARPCRLHPDALPFAWTRSRSTCLDLLEEWHARGELDVRLLAYGRTGRDATIAYPGTTFDGLREMVHWGRHWGLLPARVGLGI